MPAPPHDPPSPPRLTRYPVGLPGGGSQLKWIFRDPAALALGFCGAPRAPWGTGNADCVWFWKVRSSSSTEGEARAGSQLGHPLPPQTLTPATRGRRGPCNTQGAGTPALQPLPGAPRGAPGHPAQLGGGPTRVFGKTRRRGETVWQPRDCSQEDIRSSFQEPSSLIFPTSASGGALTSRRLRSHQN